MTETADPPVLAVEQLRFSYRTSRGMVLAVADASMVIGERQAVGLVGESGSGKSSLARAMLGLLPRRIAQIERGRIIIRGCDVSGRASASGSGCAARRWRSCSRIRSVS